MTQFTPDRAQGVPGMGMVFESIAYLFAPADPATHYRVLVADDWEVKPVPFDGPEVVLWGRTPYLPGGEVLDPIRFAVRREWSLGLLRRRPPTDLVLHRLHRLEPPRWEAGVARNTARNALFSGALVELGRGDRKPRVIDAVAREAGAASPADRGLRLSLDGYALGRLKVDGSREVQLRVSRSGHPSDPGRGLDALARLEEAGVPLVPGPVERGETSGASWTTETVLNGVRPRRLSRRVSSDVVDLCSRLPSAGAVSSLEERLDIVARSVPRWRKGLDRVLERLSPVVADVPAIMQHGDLWAGNLLEDSGRLSGIIDWDCYHQAGLPGVDLLQLVIGERETRGKESFREIWRSRPWLSDEYRSLTFAYWRSLGIRPEDDFLEAVAIDCWANRVARVFVRQPHMIDPSWIEANVDSVLGPLVGGAA